ncbi:hypothetical protein SAMN00790413_01501 [Deinococcus hopiensis KR-140]|uniref:Uncharacterized protein n=1 Tax=Deinococcus hopiensis KR-140 TaxID=695939 RepID=A0A1W1VFV5_9DEIO|nr:hypothetical protein SAMN00790413_01501 [Deinococcus hopiensis KR-140]
MWREWQDQQETLSALFHTLLGSDRGNAFFRGATPPVLHLPHFDVACAEVPALTSAPRGLGERTKREKEGEQEQVREHIDTGLMHAVHLCGRAPRPGRWTGWNRGVHPLAEATNTRTAQRRERHPRSRSSPQSIRNPAASS